MRGSSQGEKRIFSTTHFAFIVMNAHTKTLLEGVRREWLDWLHWWKGQDYEKVRKVSMIIGSLLYFVIMAIL